MFEWNKCELHIPSFQMTLLVLIRKFYPRVKLILYNQSHFVYDFVGQELKKLAATDFSKLNKPCLLHKFFSPLKQNPLALCHSK